VVSGRAGGEGMSGNQLFLAGFFGLAFAVALLSAFPDFGLEAPFLEGCFPRYASLIASISASVYSPVGPIYLNGFIPRRWKRILTASEVMPSRPAISETGIPSIYTIIATFTDVNQVEKLKNYINITLKRYMYQNDTTRMVEMTHFVLKGLAVLLYNRIDKKRKIFKFLNFFCQNLDSPTRRVYIRL
jgi:hypothetical protein